MQLFELQTLEVVVGVGVSVAEIVEVGVGVPVMVGVSVADGVAVSAGVGTRVADSETPGVIDVGDSIEGIGDSPKSPPGGVVNVQNVPPLS